VTLYEAPTVASLAKLLRGEREEGSLLEESDRRAQKRRAVARTREAGRA